jgi:excisionase family DNA binding protein
VTADAFTTQRGDQELLTVDDVARWLNVPKRWVYDRARRGDLPAGRAGKYLRFRRADVAAYIERMFSQP